MIRSLDDDDDDDDDDDEEEEEEEEEEEWYTGSDNGDYDPGQMDAVRWSLLMSCMALKTGSSTNQLMYGRKLIWARSITLNDHVLIQTTLNHINTPLVHYTPTYLHQLQ